jgi:polysaccharide deacetylase family protein (PEP-CTERM system associated)
MFKKQAAAVAPATGREGREVAAPAGEIRNMLSFDVEDLDAMNFASMDQFRDWKLPSRVCPAMNVLLDVLAAYGARATMFFLGTVAERYPELVRRAQAEGHEIASHGYGHRLAYSQTAGEFRDDVRKSVEILQQISGAPVHGYRAPSWSISKATPWAYEILADLGFRYDASLFPFRTYLYGDSAAPVATFVVPAGSGRIFEVPASVLTLGKRRLPFGGGFYFRALPWFVTRWATAWTNRQGRPVVFYLHPREIDPEQPRLPLPWRDRLVAYVNLGTTLGKLKRLLALGPTRTIDDFLQVQFIPSLSARAAA